MRYSCLRATAMVAFAASVDAQVPTRVWSTLGSVRDFGYSTAVLRDVTGDGVADVVVGAPSQYAPQARVVLCSGSNGTLVWETFGNTSTFGIDVACVGDADGDGFDDVAVGACGPYIGWGNGSGFVQLLSGRTGQVHWTVHGTTLSALQLGFEVHAIGDVNGDGCGDVWVVHGMPGSGAGYAAMILSGADGALLRVHDAHSTPNHWERACALGDRDEDGFDDYAIGCPRDFLPGTTPQYFGSVTFASGATGAPFLVVQGQPVTGGPGSTAFGVSLAAFGDMNGDGVVDLVVGDHEWDLPQAEAGRTRVISGANGAVLATYGSSSSLRHGLQVLATGDLTGDGHGDFAMMSWDLTLATPAWVIQTADGRSGQVLQTLLPPVYWNVLGLSCRLDLNGDRIPDLISGRPSTWPSMPVPPYYGSVHVFDLGYGGTRPLAQTRGVGCGSQGRLPQFRVEGLPKLGNTVRTIGRALPPSSVALLAFGAPLQQSLTTLGAPGCTAYVAPGVLFAGTTNSGGYVRFDFPVPAAPALQGMALSAQWLAFDAGANALGVVLSDVADLELQS